MRTTTLQIAILAWATAFFSVGPTLKGQESAAKYTIVIHGGAGGDPTAWSQEYQQQRRDGLTTALDLGVRLLSDKQAALDVVEQVVRSMEDNPTFNAGRGCVLNQQGHHELDASIMDGRNLNCGAVASVTKCKHPITLARLVMTETRHVLLMGAGADELGSIHQLEQAEADYFRTERQRLRWQKWLDKQQKSAGPVLGEGRVPYLGTVGCVVLDQHGNLAAGTSTGGLMGKRWGRVGDSPVIGAGNYADNGTCAVSGTGIGEEFIRRSVASDIAARMRYAGHELPTAAAATIATLPDNCGGIIAVDAQGNAVMEFNTPGMSRAFANSSGERSVLLGREDASAS